MPAEISLIKYSFKVPSASRSIQSSTYYSNRSGNCAIRFLLHYVVASMLAIPEVRHTRPLRFNSTFVPQCYIPADPSLYPGFICTMPKDLK